MHCSMWKKAAYRPSPNEESARLSREREERRKARLVQVREQEKAIARHVRVRVREEREEERRALEDHLKSAVVASHSAELHSLEQQYVSRAGQLGKAHRDAQKINEEVGRLEELRLLLAARQRCRAQDRHSAAMKELSSNQVRKTEKRVRRAASTKQALALERERAQEAIARSQKGPALIMDLAVGRGQRVSLREVKGFVSSYYHIPSTVVQRAAPLETRGPSAHQMADLAAQQDRQTEKLSEAVQQEQKEKARLRHKHAMAKVRLEKDKNDVISQLSALQREDRSVRQQRLASMPPDLFQPAQHRVQVAEEQQTDMEQAFMKLFVQTHGAPLPATALSRLTDETEEGSPYHPAPPLHHHDPAPPPLPPSPSPSTPPPNDSPQPASSSGPSHNEELPSSSITTDVANESQPCPPPSPLGSYSPPNPVLSISEVTPSVVASFEHSKSSSSADADGSRVSSGKRETSSGDTLPVIEEEAEWEGGGEAARQGGLVRVSSGNKRGGGVASEEDCREYLKHEKGEEAGVIGRREGMQRLLGLIRCQHEAWREWISGRARQGLLSSASEDSSLERPEPLSIFTLSSSGRDVTGSSVQPEDTSSEDGPLVDSGPQTIATHQAPTALGSTHSHTPLQSQPWLSTAYRKPTSQDQSKLVQAASASPIPNLSITACETTEPWLSTSARPDDSSTSFVSNNGQGTTALLPQTRGQLATAYRKHAWQDPPKLDHSASASPVPHLSITACETTTEEHAVPETAEPPEPILDRVPHQDHPNPNAPLPLLHPPLLWRDGVYIAPGATSTSHFSSGTRAPLLTSAPPPSTVAHSRDFKLTTLEASKFLAGDRNQAPLNVGARGQDNPVGARSRDTSGPPLPLATADRDQSHLLSLPPLSLLSPSDGGNRNLSQSASPPPPSFPSHGEFSYGHTQQDYRGHSDEVPTIKHATEGSGSETASDLGAVEADYQSPLDRPKRTDWSASPRSSEDQPTFIGSPATLQTSGDFSENNSSAYDSYASLPTTGEGGRSPQNLHSSHAQQTGVSTDPSLHQLSPDTEGPSLHQISPDPVQPSLLTGLADVPRTTQTGPGTVERNSLGMHAQILAARASTSPLFSSEPLVVLKQPTAEIEAVPCEHMTARHTTSTTPHFDIRASAVSDGPVASRGSSTVDGTHDSGVVFSPLQSSSATLGLQEAFLHRKRDFVQKSQARLREIEARTSAKRVQDAQLGGAGHPLKMAATKSSLQHNTDRYQEPEHQHHVVQFSSPLLQHASDAVCPTKYSRAPYKTRLSSKAPIGAKEMRERNKRFYTRLPEVREQKKQESRAKAYKANRENAKQYELKVRGMQTRLRAEPAQPLLQPLPTGNTMHSKRPPFR